MLVLVVNIAWCFVGAEKIMDHKNIAIYIGLLLSHIMAVIVILYGMIFVPSKLYLLITSCDELRSDPRFTGSYENITKFTKVMTKLCLKTTKYLDGIKMNRDTISLVSLFIENMRSGDVGLTFMKLFIIDKTTMVTVFGSLISYIIVIMQFKPS
ncbi:hypothetical protein SNE40_003618 [Patella caerulea]|uniref:Uncharacterized protein n=1 Tax=Patella caerulea TaxID=87958 RepID=A0AAN8KEJ9_PATCE